MACGTAVDPMAMTNPCSCCCANFGCGQHAGVYKPFPLTLPFMLSIAGSCPHGIRHVVSGVLTYQLPTVDQNPCIHPEHYTCGTPPYEISAAFCICQFTWVIADADIPPCGEYVAGITLRCNPPNYRPRVDGSIPVWPGTGCSHQRLDTCVFWVDILVMRSDKVPRTVAVRCTADDPPICFDQVQDCETCVFTEAVTTGGEVVCCPASCPNCWCISNCSTETVCENCPDTGFCCGGCEDEYLILNCVDADNVPISCGPSCGPSGDFCGSHKRLYSWGHFSCMADAQIEGCNPIGCPPDTKNTGDFFLHLDQHPLYDNENFFIGFADNCVDDYIQITC